MIKTNLVQFFTTRLQRKLILMISILVTLITALI